jgi:integrase
MALRPPVDADAQEAPSAARRFARAASPRGCAHARMIHAGASLKALQTVLGHSSAAFTLTTYGDVFDADLDGLAERLDKLEQSLSRPHDGPGHSAREIATAG